MRDPTWPEIREWAERRLGQTLDALVDAKGEQACGDAQGRVKMLREVLKLPDILMTKQVIDQQLATKQRT